MIKLLKNLTRREWILSGISFLLIIAQVWLELKMPDYMSEITVLVQTEGSKMADILLNGGYMLLCAFGGLIAAIIVGPSANSTKLTVIPSSSKNPCSFAFNTDQRLP